MEYYGYQGFGLCSILTTVVFRTVVRFKSLTCFTMPQLSCFYLSIPHLITCFSGQANSDPALTADFCINWNSNALPLCSIHRSILRLNIYIGGSIVQPCSSVLALMF